MAEDSGWGQWLRTVAGDSDWGQWLPGQCAGYKQSLRTSLPYSGNTASRRVQQLPNTHRACPPIALQPIVHSTLALFSVSQVNRVLYCRSIAVLFLGKACVKKPSPALFPVGHTWLQAAHTILQREGKRQGLAMMC